MISFFITYILLGVGLAMDAFSVSVANGIREGKMSKGRKCLIAGTYGFFQIVMPLAGWICVRTVVGIFNKLQGFVPVIALVLLVFIGGKMIYEALKGDEPEAEKVTGVSGVELLLQGIATSIDALSVGFTIENLDLCTATLASFIIGIVTFVICLIGLAIGRTLGIRLTKYSGIAGGLILIVVGVQIFIRAIGGF
ncbi:MAG: manganese efflux pump MntP family protein [Lachnospiraceae bacterium]|nr:manganese efflux pump MntP family protein [Lachnospiraceae bacterium]